MTCAWGVTLLCLTGARGVTRDTVFLRNRRRYFLLDIGFLQPAAAARVSGALCICSALQALEALIQTHTQPQLTPRRRYVTRARHCVFYFSPTRGGGGDAWRGVETREQQDTFTVRVRRCNKRETHNFYRTPSGVLVFSSFFSLSGWQTFCDSGGSWFSLNEGNLLYVDLLFFYVCLILFVCLPLIDLKTCDFHASFAFHMLIFEGNFNQ